MKMNFEILCLVTLLPAVFNEHPGPMNTLFRTPIFATSSGIRLFRRPFHNEHPPPFEQTILTRKCSLLDTGGTTPAIGKCVTVGFIQKITDGCWKLFSIANHRKNWFLDLLYLPSRKLSPHLPPKNHHFRSSPPKNILGMHHKLYYLYLLLYYIIYII